MQYKTIILELLQQNPQMHEQLRQERKLLTTVEALAREFKTHHETLKEALATATPGSDPRQISSQALELALKIMKDHLSAESPRDEDKALSLDEAMAFIRNHSRRG